MFVSVTEQKFCDPSFMISCKSDLCCFNVWIKLLLTLFQTEAALDTPTWMSETEDEIVQTTITPSRNDADLFSGAAGGGGGVQCVNHVCWVWLRCQVQYH